MQNIALYIGDNDYDKTQIMMKIIDTAKLQNKQVVTNIDGYRLEEYVPDKIKFYRVKNVSNDLVNKIIIKERINTLHDMFVDKIIKYLYAKGDVLVLDELDVNLSSQEIIYVSMIISEIKDLWTSIHVSGCSEYLLRLFTTIDYDNYTETYELNVYYVSDNMNSIGIAEDDVIEYIDKIQG